MDKQREMFEAWADANVGKEYDVDGKPNYTAISMRSVMWETWQAAIAAQSEVLLGWKLVPIVPTEQMLDAAREAAIGWSDGFPDHQECYCVMLSAAPEPTK